MDILRELAGGDRRSIGRADRVVALVLKIPALLDDVVAGFLHDDPVIRMRCVDVAEKVSVVHPEWFQPHKNAVLSPASMVEEKEVRWHMAQMLPRLQLSAAERRRAVARLFKLRARVIPLLRDAVKYGSPAERSRAKKLLIGVDRAPAAPAGGRDAV